MFKSSRDSREAQPLKDKIAEKAGEFIVGAVAAGAAMHIVGSELSKYQDISPEQMQEAMKPKEVQKMKGELPSSREFNENVEMPEEDKTAATEEVGVEIDTNDSFFLNTVYNAQTMKEDDWRILMNVTKNHEYLIEKLKSSLAHTLPINIIVDNTKLRASVGYKKYNIIGTGRDLRIVPEIQITLVSPDKGFLQEIAGKIITNKSKLQVELVSSDYEKIK